MTEPSAELLLACNTWIRDVLRISPANEKWYTQALADFIAAREELIDERAEERWKARVRILLGDKDVMKAREHRVRELVEKFEEYSKTDTSPLASPAQIQARRDCFKFCADELQAALDGEKPLAKTKTR